MKRTYLVKLAVAVAMTATLAAAGTPASAKIGPAAALAVSAAQVGEVTVTSETLNVRSGPSTGDGIIGKLTCGQKVQPTGKTTDGSWWRITLNGATGFIFAQYAKEGGTCGSTAAAPAPAAAAAPAPAAAAGGSVFTVSSATLNVRSGPGYGFSILGKLNQGQTINATGKTADGAWLQFDYNGTKAFVFAQYTSSGGAAPAAGPAAAAPAKATGSFEVGAHIKDPEKLDLMTSTGMTWVKYQVVFSGGAPDMSGLIAQIHGSGMKILLGAIGDRSRVSDRSYHIEFAAGLAALAKQGADAIEVWNEPNLDREWGGGGNNKVNPEDYFNLLKEAYTAIKAANGGTMVVSGAPAPTGAAGGNCRGDICDDKPFLERIAAAGAVNFMDCQGAHFNGSPNAPDLRNGGPTGDHYSWYFWGTFDMTYNALGGKVPICFTEMGYTTKDGIDGSMPGNFSWANNITIGNQSEWSGRLVTLLKESGRARLAIFWNWNFRTWVPGDGGDPQSGYSLFRPDGSCPSCGTIKAAMGK